MKRIIRIFAVIAVATMVIAAPWAIKLDAQSGLAFRKTAALAEGSNSGPGGGNSGSGGNSGPGGGDHGSNGNGDHKGGDGKEAAGDDADSQKDRRRGNQKLRRLGPHGEKIEIDGNRIEITYPDGFREEIANGALELRDPAGRIVIRRAATDRDLKRLQAF